MLDSLVAPIYNERNLTQQGNKMATLKAYEVTDVSKIPAGALFISVDNDNIVKAHFGETSLIGSDVYTYGGENSVNLGESFTPVDKPVLIELPMSLSAITDVPKPYWANYVTISGCGEVVFWEFEPTTEMNGDGFDDYFYDFEVLNESAGKTKLLHYYRKRYSISELEN